MKIESTIRDAYKRQKELNVLIQREVENFKVRFNKDWYYIDRLKKEESFAQKIETGQVNAKLEIDDFFACTLVVQNSTEISSATQLIEELFEVDSRKPESPKTTRARPSEFQFDDLRMYVRLRPPPQGRREIDLIQFEVQIKTFLQHAWGIATHDLTYKTDSVKWSRLRLAHQIRAMLEHAELSIEQFEELAGSPSMAKEHTEYAEIAKIIDELKIRWQSSSLPYDLQRLARTLRTAFEKLGVDISTAFAYVDKETKVGRGAEELNLSPYSAILQSILANHKIDISASRRKRPKRIMLSADVELGLNLNEAVDELFRVF